MSRDPLGTIEVLAYRGEPIRLWLFWAEDWDGNHINLSPDDEEFIGTNAEAEAELKERCDHYELYYSALVAKGGYDSKGIVGAKL